MSNTATGRWDIPGRTETDTPHEPQSHPGGNPNPTSAPQPAPTPAAEEAPTAEEAPAKPPMTSRMASRMPLAQWFNDMRADSAARRARSDAPWAMRWMGEQPTSIRDHVDYLLHERYKRKDGRKGWGLQTTAPVINGTHALLYRAYGLSIGLAVTMLCYALAWNAQRPGRFLLVVAGLHYISENLSTWLARY